MSKVIFLLEEPSMEHLLRGLLPRVMPEGFEGLNWVLIPHSGKSDLEASIPRKIRAWREPGVRFFIIRDQDAAECVTVKERLVQLAITAGRPDTLVRIACRELEAWYFGDLGELAQVYETSSVSKLGGRRAFRTPDAVVNPSGQLEKHIAAFGKIDAARRMGSRLSLVEEGQPGANSSKSYQQTVTSLRTLFRE